MKRYNEDYYVGEENYYSNQKLSQRSFWRRNRWFILAVGTLTVLVILLASSTFYLLTTRTSTTTEPSPQRSSPPAPQTTAAAPAGTTAPVATSIPPTATSTLKTMPKNISIPCVSNTEGPCNDSAIDVKLVNIVVDPSYGPQDRLICNFTLTNKGVTPAQVSGGLDAFAKNLIFLQDPTGSSINPDGGTLLNTSSFTAGESLPLTVTFPLAPQSGSTYLLNITLGVSKNYPSGAVYSAATYQTLNLTI